MTEDNRSMLPLIWGGKKKKDVFAVLNGIFYI